MRRAAWIGLGLGLIGVAGALVRLPHVTLLGGLPLALTGGREKVPADTGSTARVVAPSERALPRPLRSPSGSPAAISCQGARKVVRQARALLAAPPRAIDPKAYGEAVVDWLDPHGLWSVAPDSPVAPAVRKHAQDLLRELESEPVDGPCPVANEIGAELGGWVTELRGVFLNARRSARALRPDEAFALAALPAFEDGASVRPARALAAELGQRAGAVRASFGDSLEEASQAALARVVPERNAPWAEIVLASALRAYLPQIDPHGGWAPFEEETSLYEVDLEAAPPARLWRKMARTAVGVRVDEAPLAPLALGDVVLAVDGLATAGLSLEQAEQAALIDGDAASGVLKHVTILRGASATPLRLEIAPPNEQVAAKEAAAGLDGYRIRYGNNEVFVVPLGDVPDNLGDELGATLGHARAEGRLAGVVLDLRGNGGGSTDGANAALGLFLPGAKLFPLRRRDGTIEVERAPVPSASDRWSGPVAALVDGDTASAAEMIAGALAAYHRGPVVGARTYGKGCAQEYLDDDAGAGVLRLTTLVYALPDGAPVQRTGIGPTLKLGLPRSTEREAILTHALAAWQGPDVRDLQLVHETPWPGHNGQVGPCDDSVVCKALRALGAPRTSVARGR